MDLTKEEKERKDKAKKIIDNFKTQELTIMSNNYRFSTFKFFNLVYLYIMGVEGQFTDLLGKDNKNGFINDFIELTAKIKEQVKLDLIDLRYNIGFNIPKQGEEVVAAANKKFQETYDDDEFTFAENIDFMVEDAVDYGSGFLMLWKGSDGVLMNSHIDPMKIIFNQYDFRGGAKILTIRKALRSIISNPIYSEEAKEALKDLYDDWTEHEEDIITLHKVATPTGKEDKGDIVDVWYLEKDILFFSNETDIPLFWKMDAQKRRGFADSVGIGAYEKGFNILMGLKKNRERMEVVMNIMSKMVFYQKKTGTEAGDDLIGTSYTDLPDGIILGTESDLEPSNLGGEKQFQVLMQTLSNLKEEAGSKLTINEALQGKTLPSGISFALGNQQMEMASSVLKDAQKSYGKWLRKIYKLVITPYMLHMFDSKEDIKKYITVTDLNVLKQGAVEDRLILAEIQHSINPETINQPFDFNKTKKLIEEDMQKNGFITGDLLEVIRTNVQDIDVIVTGERKSKVQTQAFIESLIQVQITNPEMLQNPTFIKLQKAKARTDTGLTPVEVDELLKIEK